VLKVDGKVVASEKMNLMDRTFILVLQWDETFDVAPAPAKRERYQTASVTALVAVTLFSQAGIGCHPSVCAVRLTNLSGDLDQASCTLQPQKTQQPKGTWRPILYSTILVFL